VGCPESGQFVKWGCYANRLSSTTILRKEDHADWDAGIFGEAKCPTKSELDCWLDVDDHRGRWGAVAPLDKGSVDANPRLVRAVFWTLCVPADRVVLEKIHGRPSVGLDSALARRAFLRCWENSVKDRALTRGHESYQQVLDDLAETF